jgi:hypothetical protein
VSLNNKPNGVFSPGWSGFRPAGDGLHPRWSGTLWDTTRRVRPSRASEAGRRHTFQYLELKTRILIFSKSCRDKFDPRERGGLAGLQIKGREYPPFTPCHRFPTGGGTEKGLNLFRFSEGGRRNHSSWGRLWCRSCSMWCLPSSFSRGKLRSLAFWRV